jgi:hypothetical protein
VSLLLPQRNLGTGECVVACVVPGPLLQRELRQLSVCPALHIWIAFILLVCGANPHPSFLPGRKDSRDPVISVAKRRAIAFLKEPRLSLWSGFRWINLNPDRPGQK